MMSLPEPRRRDMLSREREESHPLHEISKLALDQWAERCRGEQPVVPLFAEGAEDEHHVLTTAETAGRLGIGPRLRCFGFEIVQGKHATLFAHETGDFATCQL